jgi:2-amino-4-hydroxy-6-hydroxymethyldihydropteridine diphosphokinase
VNDSTLPTWTPAYIGIGSNLNDPKVQVARGFDALSKLSRTRLVAKSRLFRSAPLGPQDQPEYVNAVAGLLTQLDARGLLKELKAIELSLGRESPIVRWGPRVIDLDLLVFGGARIDSEDLTIPHRGVAERSFVLQPLLDVAPDLDIPGLGRASSLALRVNLDCRVL